MRVLLIATAAFILIAFPGRAAAQDDVGSVTGTVQDAAGAALQGAAVTLQNSGGGAVRGMATSRDGTFSFESVEPGMYTLVVRHLGYGEVVRAVTARAGATLTIEVALTMEGIELETVIISGSRIPEKVLDVPVALSVLGAEEIQEAPGQSVYEALRSEPGVHVADVGLDSRSFALRGFNRAFNAGTVLMADYRVADLPSLGLPIFGYAPMYRLDVDRIEIIRGPAGALYGPGFTVGVVHVLSKSPFADPGTSFLLSGGERSVRAGEIRHAGVVGSVGYKIIADFLTGDDWPWDPADEADAIAMNGDVVERVNRTERRKVSAVVTWLGEGGASLTAAGGTGVASVNALNDVGAARINDGWYSYLQVRGAVGGFFGQAYVNWQGDPLTSYLYALDADGNGEADPLIQRDLSYNAQAQYRFGRLGPAELMAGIDAKWVRPRTGSTITGENEDIDHYAEHGAYVHTSVRVHERVELSAAIRGDWFLPLKSLDFSPRVAAIYKPSERHAFRFSANRAYSLPGRGPLYDDMLIGTIPGGALGLQGGFVPLKWRGRRDGYTWTRDSAYASFANSDLVAYSLVNPGEPVPVGMSLDVAYAAAQSAMGTSTDFAAALESRGISLSTAEATELLAALAPGRLPVEGFSDGTLLLGFTPWAATPVTTLRTVPRPESQATESLEVGYRGSVGRRVQVQVEAWIVRRGGYSRSAPITPWVTVPDLADDLRSALSAALASNPDTRSLLEELGLDASELSGVLTDLGAAALPGGASPIAVAMPEQARPEPGEMPTVFMTGQTFGRATFMGMDLAAEMRASDRVRLWGNVSLLRDNEFDGEELGVDDPDVFLPANLPRVKGTLGGSYRAPAGWSVNLSARYRSGFVVMSGIPTGKVEPSLLFDLGLGFDMSRVRPGLKVHVGATNLLDTHHREFVHAPKLGRLALIRLVYDP